MTAAATQQQEAVVAEAVRNSVDGGQWPPPSAKEYRRSDIHREQQEKQLAYQSGPWLSLFAAPPSDSSAVATQYGVPGSEKVACQQRWRNTGGAAERMGEGYKREGETQGMGTSDEPEEERRHARLSGERNLII
jgi:hypothetical protein